VSIPFFEWGKLDRSDERDDYVASRVRYALQDAASKGLRTGQCKGS
jgi:hypothetical protein